MSPTRFVTAGALAAMVALGLAGCGHSTPAKQPDELGQIQSTLDSIDSEMAGDDAP